MTDPDDRMIGKVVRVIDDGSRWGPTAYTKMDVKTTLCSTGHYDPECVLTAFNAAADRGLIAKVGDGWIPSGDSERYLKPGTINSTVEP